MANQIEVLCAVIPSTLTFGGAHALPESRCPVAPLDAGPSYSRARLPDYSVVKSGPTMASAVALSRRYALLGNLAPRQQEFAESLAFASRWSEEQANAEKWALHSKEQASLAWRHTMALVEQVKPFLLASVPRDAELANELTPLVTVCNVVSERSREAWKSSKARERAAARAVVKATEKPEEPKPLRLNRGVTGHTGDRREWQRTAGGTC